jgi:hypothetical protein
LLRCRKHFGNRRPNSRRVRLRHSKLWKFRERLQVLHPFPPSEVGRKVLSRLQTALHFFDIEFPKDLTSAIDPDLQGEPDLVKNRGEGQWYDRGIKRGDQSDVWDGYETDGTGGGPMGQKYIGLNAA